MNKWNRWTEKRERGKSWGLVTMARVSQQASLVNASYVEIFTTTADAATMALVWQSSLAGPDSVVLKNAVLTISSMFT